MELAPDITPEELQVFLQEADEQLQLLDEDLVRLEQEHDNEELVQEIFRAAHTLKGSSAMLGYTPMTELAHAMENLLDKFRKGTLTPSTPVFDALLLSLDALRDLRETLESPDAAPTDITTVVRELDKVAREKSQESAEVPPDGEGTTASLQPALEISSEAKERLEAAITSGKKPLSVKVALSVGPPWSAMRCFQILQETSGLGDVITSSPSAKAIEEGVTASDLELVLATSAEEDEVRRVVASVIDVERVDVTPLEERAKVESDLTRSKDLGAAASDRELRTVRIDVARLDNLMNLVGELVIERTRISQIGKILEARYREDDLVHSLGVTTSNVVKVFNELQEDIMQVRMVPIGRVFNGLPRVARDVAQKLGKKLDLTMDGQETEIDRSLAERIRDPLVHMLRNAVDHGIETPELRISRGKPEKGTVKLDARHEQSHIVITLEDDGGGIDPEVMKAVALKRDVITQELADKISDKEAIRLIFSSGLSTASEVTDVSGRGVGMDIVNANIEATNGYIDVETELEKGTKFTLGLPLTLATIQGLLLPVGGETYAVPLIYVTEAVLLTKDMVSTIHGSEVINLRGSVMPLIRLREVFGIEDAHPTTEFAVVVRSGDRVVGIVADEVKEPQEIVVKTLGQYIGDTNGISGASILADGQVVLILDVISLIQRATSNARDREHRSLVSMS